MKAAPHRLCMRPRRQVCASAKRRAKDPADFDRDYDKIREALLSEGFGLSSLLNATSGGFGAVRSIANPIGRAYRRILDSITPWELRTSEWKAPPEAIAKAESIWRRHGVENATSGLAFCTCRVARGWRSDRSGEALSDDELEFVVSRLDLISRSLSCTGVGASELAERAPGLKQMTASDLTQRLLLVKRLVPSADAGELLLRAPELLDLDTETIARAEQTIAVLRARLPKVTCLSQMVVEEPRVLKLTANETELALDQLFSLWTLEQVQMSDRDNAFFAEELALALLTLSRAQD